MIMRLGFIKSKLCYAILPLWWLWCAPLLANTPLDRIVAVVNEDVVMQSELEKRLRTVRDQMREQGAALPPTTVLERQVLDRLIENRIQLQLANHFNIKVPEEELNQTINNIAGENQVSLTEFRKILEDDGYSYKQFREDIRNELIVMKLRKKQVENRVMVTEREIDNYLTNQEFQGEFLAEIHLSHILLVPPKEATEEDIEQVKQKATQVRERLLAGEDFAELAMEVSDGKNAENGGDLGWRKMEDMPSIFADYIPNMSQGDISELIQSPSGFHIIKITDIKNNDKNIIKQTLARHILIKTDALITDEKAKEKLNQLKQRIENGEDFATLAKGNSADPVSAIEGGDLGWAGPGQFVPKFQQTIDQLPLNEISVPFQTRFGWHIVEVLNRRDYDNTGTMKRAKARSEIRSRKLKESVQAWLRQLRDEAYVEYRLDDD